MRKNFDFVKNANKFFIVAGALLLIGVIVLCISGVKLDINFTGGCIASYSYTGEIDLDEAKAVIEGKTEYPVKVSKNDSLTSGESILSVSITAKNGLTNENQSEINKALEEKYKDNGLKLHESNNVSATVGGKFFAKSIFAVVLAAAFIVIYVAIRFRNIGGASAAISALVALVHDVLIAFFSCVVLGINVDSNFIAVVLTLFGYSLNNTIVIYDRVRENKRKYPDHTTAELVNESINGTLIRSLITTATTLFAVVAIAVISELRGVQSLRSLVIPMAVGLIAGFYSSVCIAGPLWVKWKNRSEKNKKSKNSYTSYRKPKKSGV